MDALIEPMLNSAHDGSRGSAAAARPTRRNSAWRRALRAGDRDAVAAIEARFGRVLAGFLRDALRDPGGAEDVLQQVLLEIWRRGPDYDPERASLLTWMMTIARSRAIDERRRRRPEPVEPAAVAASAGAGPAEVDRLLERWRLAGLLDRIPQEEAAACGCASTRNWRSRRSPRGWASRSAP